MHLNGLAADLPPQAASSPADARKVLPKPGKRLLQLDLTYMHLNGLAAAPS